MQFEKQLKNINKAWSEVKEKNNPELEKKLNIIHDFVLSLEFPDKFSRTEREDLGKLAQELGYKTTTRFSGWWKTQNRDLAD
jgi:hypothetical protein